MKHAGQSILRIALLALLGSLGACAQPDPPTISLYQAVHRGDINQIERNIKAGADLNEQDPEGHLPIHVAAAAGRAPIVDLLIKGGADPNGLDRDGRTAMQMAILNGKIPVAKLLKRRGAALPADSLFLYAVRNEVAQREVLDFLIQNGAGVDRQGPDGDTPLVLAIRRRDRVMVKRLIERGADVNLPSADGTLPLLLARELGEPEIERLLHRQGAEAGVIP